MLISHHCVSVLVLQRLFLAGVVRKFSCAFLLLGDAHLTAAPECERDGRRADEESGKLDGN